MAILMLLAAPAAVGQEPASLTRYQAIPTAPASTANGESAELAMSQDKFDRMTVPVRLGSSRPFNFLVDTGSNRTSVSRELAQELGLSQQSSAELHSSTGESRVAMAWLPELRVNRRAVRNISAPMLEAANIGADGILGIDSLRAQRVVFDFGSGRLSILSGSTAVPIEEGAIVVRAKRREGRLIVTDAEVDGEKVNVVLDTGSALTVGNAALRSRLERRGALDSGGSIDVVSVTGHALRGEVVHIKRIEIGGARLEGLPLVFAEAHTFRLLHLDRRPAILLGMDALRGFDQVAIDFADRTISLVLPKERRPS